MHSIWPSSDMVLHAISNIYFESKPWASLDMDEATASHRIDHVLSRKGGASQRQQYRASSIVHESNLCKLLYTLFAWGLLPAMLVQRLAKAAHDDLLHGVSLSTRSHCVCQNWDPLESTIATLGHNW